MGKKHKRQLSRIRTQALQLHQQAFKERTQAEWHARVATAENTRAANCWFECRRLIGMQLRISNPPDHPQMLDCRFTFDGFNLKCLEPDMLHSIVSSAVGQVASELRHHLHNAPCPGAPHDER